MSSEDPPNASPNDAVKRSRYTHRQLQLLRQGSTATPLRAIAHIDLDAFYAQCEMVRLGTPRDTPLAVRQWDSLIAVNYAARPFGITRMITAAEARKTCPNIVLQHVATFREGEGGRWAYRDDAFMNIKTDKVSLDPYRAESRKILKTMKEALERWCTHESDGEIHRFTQGLSATLEKASIDEVFIDLSPIVYSVLLQRYPELRPGPQDGDRDAELPPPPTTAVQWYPEDCLIDLDLHEREEDDPDWDDIVMLTGAEIVRSVRRAVWDSMKYTCSAGLARNKMLAKLGSACNKPDKQTVVRNRAVQHFLGGYKFTQIRMLGGKLGDQITSYFGTEKVSDLLNVTLEQFRAKLDDHTASWLYGIIRGDDRTEVNPRTQIKSMLSAKSFRPSINSLEQAEKWLHIFAADIYGRLVEDGVLENRRRPRVIALHHRTAQTRSRQIPIPAANAIDENLLFELAMTLMRQVMADGQPWPCSNLSLSVSSFEDGVSKNRAIEGFLLRGDQAKSLNHGSRPRDDETPMNEQLPSEKKRKVDDSGIKRFFSQPPQDDRPVFDRENPRPKEDHDNSTLPVAVPEAEVDDNIMPHYTCDRCSRSIPELEREEHDDWHFAKDLEVQERQEARDAQPQSRPTPSSSAPRGSSTRARGGRGGRGGRGKPERGQMRLAFQ
ncbi:putative sister chromatid cohesion protein (Eso1) [Penicillium brasilianum]|uniref:DNA polymerase eta n=1 Tax=Penicillium brasilianum TaxID=104259 RepID=A0A1S9RWJ7_PENBI|nr:putative sister chromatid cohesion protein (Eso1) [Penicillium brasilianum]